jgi:hypothetical protein
VDRRAPNAHPTDLSSSHDATARSDPTLASPISQSPSNQGMPNAPPSARQVQASSPNYLPAVPASSIRSTDAALPSYAYPAGAPQSGKC